MSRILNLTSPHTTGKDVTALQRAIIHALVDIRREPCDLNVDGEYGPATRDAEAHAAYALGAAKPRDHKRAQAIILHPALRTPLELKRARAYKAAAKKRQGSGSVGAVLLALELARRSPRITESPAGSNRGQLIDVMQREVDMLAQPWCGAFVHYALKHGGGIDVTHEVRYCPSTESHAKAGTGGFRTWVPASRAEQAPVGSLVLYGEHQADHVEILCSRSDGNTVRTVGGNTSPGDGGSQANGGGVFERRRPVAGGFPVRGFAVPRWPS